MKYTGWTTDGTMFDTSDRKGESVVFPVARVFQGWSEGLQAMTKGERRRFWIPGKLAHGEGSGGSTRRPRGTLVMDVELIDIKEPLPAPADLALPPKEAERASSGIASRVLRKGTGDAHPGPRSRVTVDYTVWTPDGEMFDSSVVTGKQLTLSLIGAPGGWAEGVPLMVVGEKRRFWIPAELANRTRPGAPREMLVYDIELIDVVAQPTVPSTPEDVAAVPANAKKTSSGLASRVLRKGSGTESPKPDSRVTVHYTGWTTDGRRFESSVERGRPATFALNRVMPGWAEGMQLMVEGETRRFWVPEELAYRGKPGRPRGTLVFDIELIEVAK